MIIDFRKCFFFNSVFVIRFIVYEYFILKNKMFLKCLLKIIPPLFKFHTFVLLLIVTVIQLFVIYREPCLHRRYIPQELESEGSSKKAVIEIYN